MAKLFSYLDYRSYLKDRFAELKKSHRSFSHRHFCAKAGFTSPNFLKLVMDGKRNLTSKSINSVADALELNDKEKNFFSSLVQFNQAKEIEEKNLAYDQLKHLRKDLPLKRIEHSQFEYLDHWYAVAIRELIGLKNFQENPEWICQRLQNQVTPKQVKKSIQLLERLGLIERNTKGNLKQKQNPLSTGDEVSSLAAHRFHQHMIEKGKEALQQTPAEFRDISSLTIPVSQKTFETIKQKVQLFRKELLAVAHEQKETDTVYQLNIQFFNLSEVLWKNSSAS